MTANEVKENVGCHQNLTRSRFRGFQEAVGEKMDTPPLNGHEDPSWTVDSSAPRRPEQAWWQKEQNPRS